METDRERERREIHIHIYPSIHMHAAIYKHGIMETRGGG